MDPTLKFTTYAAFSAASLAGGYLARRWRWLDARFSQPLHFHTVVWTWSGAALLSIWPLALDSGHAWIGVIEASVVVVLAALALGAAKLSRLTRDQAGVLAVAAPLGNLGFTLGAYLCYALLSNGTQALGLAVYGVSVMQVAGILVIYPLAHRYSRQAVGVPGLGELMRRSLLDLRAMPLYAAAAGVALAAMHIPRPKVIETWPVMEVLFYLGALGAYFGLGLRLSVRLRKEDLPTHFWANGLKFLAIPLLCLAMLALIGAVHHPVDRLARQVVLVLSVMPTALWTPMLANLFGLDVRLAGSVWLWNHVVFAVAVLPVLLWIYG